MFEGGHLGGLELRREAGGSAKFRGRFPYNKHAVLSDGGRNGGRPLKEVIKPGAFNFAIEDPERDMLFLSGHKFERPMASQRAGTLVFEDSPEALEFEATLTPEIQETSWVRDFMSAFSARLVLGLSPGFRLPPQQTVPDAVEVTDEDPSEGRAIIRTIKQAILFEMSAVTRAAYPEAQIEARSWQVHDLPTPMRRHTSFRWRA